MSEVKLMRNKLYYISLFLILMLIVNISFVYSATETYTFNPQGYFTMVAKLNLASVLIAEYEYNYKFNYSGNDFDKKDISIIIERVRK